MLENWAYFFVLEIWYIRKLIWGLDMIFFFFLRVRLGCKKIYILGLDV